MCSIAVECLCSGLVEHVSRLSLSSVLSNGQPSVKLPCITLAKSVNLRPLLSERRFSYFFDSKVGKQDRCLVQGKAATTITEDGASADLTSTESASQEWSTFANVVSGEWDGYGADFNATGVAQPLPESVVPQAFRDWGLDVCSWQTNSPTIAQPSAENFYLKTIRLIPTVGCEADAATPHSIEEKAVGKVPEGPNELESSAGRASLLAWHLGGSYVAVWPGKAVTNSGSLKSTAAVVSRRRESSGRKYWEVEHCLVDGVPGSQSGERRRIRVLQQLERSSDSALLELKGVTVYREVWEGEFRNGESLGSCGSRESSFVEGKRTSSELMKGPWKAMEFVTAMEETARERLVDWRPISKFVQLRETDASKIAPENFTDTGVILLPLGMWSRFQEMETGGWTVSAGWLVKPDNMLVSRCDCTAEGSLKEVSYSKLSKSA